jgi:hypothetical protein
MGSSKDNFRNQARIGKFNNIVMEDNIRNTLLIFLSHNSVVGFGFLVIQNLIKKYGLDNFFAVVSKMEKEKLISFSRLNDWSLPVITKSL